MVNCDSCKKEIDGEYVLGKPSLNDGKRYKICVKCMKELENCLHMLEKQEEKENEKDKPK